MYLFKFIYLFKFASGYMAYIR